MNPYSYLNTLNKFGSEGGFKPGLERIEALLSNFDHPQNELKTIHVAGSNGKGSTIAFLKGIYNEAGYRVGVFTSPPLHEFNERIMINDQKISTSELKELLQKLIPVIKKVGQNSELGQPSFFEVVTVLAFLYFYQQRVDLVILEVGLGGRLDATNIIEKPLVSVITNISLEHTAILGNSISKIAYEKAGIIKNRVPVITSVKKDEALREIKKIAISKKCEFIQLDQKYNYKLLQKNIYGQKIKVFNDKIDFIFNIKLLGEHQSRNAILAFSVVENLQKYFSVSLTQIRDGFNKVNWPGRLEIIAQKPLVILDGAHNQDSMVKLVDFIKNDLDPDLKLTIILSILEDKNIKEMINILNYSNNDLNLIITKNKSTRAESPENIKTFAAQIGLSSKIFSDVKTAIATVLRNADTRDVIIITGSLYTVGEARKYFTDQ